MNHSFEIDGVQLEFGQKRILSDVYVRCDTGTVTGLLGSNGCGKSCLMQIAFGSMKAYSRSVRCDGKHVKLPHAVKGLVNYLPQFHFIPASMKMSAALKYYNIDTTAFISAFPEYEQELNKRMDELSGGQRRMVETLIVLKSDTLFSILDEPFSHIMPLHVETLKELIAIEKKRKGIIITDHLYKHITNIADNTYLLKDGKTHLVNTPAQLVQYGYVYQL